MDKYNLVMNELKFLKYCFSEVYDEGNSIDPYYIECWWEDYEREYPHNKTKAGIIWWIIHSKW